MKTVLAVALLALLVGCSSLPSVQQCEYVKYERREAAVYFTAHCHVTPGIVQQMIK